jgi:hypothetical protein
VSCKWVKHQGPAKGFDFDVSKVEHIFDLLLKEKQLKLLEGCKFPTTQELQGRSYCKWHHSFTHNTSDCKCDSSCTCKLDIYFVSVKYVLVSVKLVYVYVKLLKI